MKKLAIIGYPIAHSISPAIYNATFPAMGIDAHYEAWPTPPEDVGSAIERLREDAMMGMNVTVPHKSAAMQYVDVVDPTAAAIGAVNCLSKRDGVITGNNTDKYGFLRALHEAGCEPRGMNVLVLGVGGSARAVAYGLLEDGASAIVLAGRNRQNVDALASQLVNGAPANEMPSRAMASVGLAPSAARVLTCGWQDESFEDYARGADLIVNCTPIGMWHGPAEGESPLPKALLRPGVWVSDLVYNPLETPLLADAREAGARAVPGLEMLVYQAAQSVILWTDREPPIDIMRSAASEALFGSR